MVDLEPYRSYGGFLKERFGQKVYRICLDAGFTCPNRDGTLGSGGCIYCSDQGSWRVNRELLPLAEQVRLEKERVRKRYGARKYLAYFQAFSSTYASPARLEKIYDSVMKDNPDVVGMIVGTRPDCVDREKLELIASYRTRDREVWIEYGLQSSHDRTLELIGRGHNVRCFADAVRLTAEYAIGVFAHVILGLPGEDRGHVIETAEFLAGLPIDGVKLHNLNIIRGTTLQRWFEEGRVKALGLEEYAELVVDFLERTDPRVVVARLTAETPSRLLIAPEWSLHKGRAIERIRQAFRRRGSYQGRLHEEGSNEHR
jgi:radical SAM protein (TIGR01212 family)